MVRKVRNIFCKTFLVLMAALVLNQSIDEIEFQPLATNNIGNFNDLNSAVEFVSEIILGQKDLFPEFKKEGGSKQSSLSKHIDNKIFEPVYVLFTPAPIKPLQTFAYPLDEKYTFLFSKEIIQPPCSQA